MIEVKIIDISLSNLGFVVLLQSLEQKKTLPIFIGMSEAQTIALQYKNIKTPRPLTHDLLKNILTLFDCKPNKVIIDDYKNNTYYSKIFLKTKDNKFQINSRPSDAIALSLKFKIPIFVKSEIMENYSIKLKSENLFKEKDNEISKTETLKNLKEQLTKFIKEERYEDAALIRDELKKYEKDGDNESS